jgi:hypothetical protein
MLGMTSLKIRCIKDSSGAGDDKLVPSRHNDATGVIPESG